MSFAILDKRIGGRLEAISIEIAKKILTPSGMKTMDAYMAAVCEHNAYLEAQRIVREEIERISRGEGDPESQDGDDA